MKGLWMLLCVLSCAVLGVVSAQAEEAASDSLFVSRAEATMANAIPREHSRWIGNDEYTVSYDVQYLGIVATFNDRYGNWESLDSSGQNLWQECLETAAANETELFVMGLATERPFSGFSRSDAPLFNETLASLRATTLMLWASENYPGVKVHKLAAGDYSAPTRGAAVWQVREVLQRAPLEEKIVATVTPLLDKRDDKLRQEWRKDIADAAPGEVNVRSSFYGALGVGYSGLWAKDLNFSGAALEGAFGFKRAYAWASAATWLDHGGNVADLIGKVGLSYALTPRFHLGGHYAYGERQLPADSQFPGRGHYDEIQAFGLHARYGTPIGNDAGWKFQVRAGINRAYWETRTDNGNDLGFNLEAGLSYAFN